MTCSAPVFEAGGPGLRPDMRRRHRWLRPGVSRWGPDTQGSPFYILVVEAPVLWGDTGMQGRRWRGCVCDLSPARLWNRGVMGSRSRVASLR